MSTSAQRTRWRSRWRKSLRCTGSLSCVGGLGREHTFAPGPAAQPFASPTAMARILYLTQIDIDDGAVRLLPDECRRTGMRRPLVVTDAGVRAAGVLKMALDALGELPHA